MRIYVNGKLAVLKKIFRSNMSLKIVCSSVATDIR